VTNRVRSTILLAFSVLFLLNADQSLCGSGTWAHVWNLGASHQIGRAYKTNFEVHHGVDENRDPDGRIDLYVGLKQ
jgi:hypothetical protein